MTELFSQSNALNIALAQNFQADGNVLEMFAPPNFVEKNIFIGWQNTNGQQFSEQVYIRKGKNIIFPKTGWEGNIQILATNAQGIEAKIIDEEIGHLFSVFLNPNLLTPGSINFDLGFHLGKYKLSNILLLIFLLGSIIFYFTIIRSVQSALLIGFILAFIILDARQIKNHFDIIKTFHASNNEITPFEGLDLFFNDCEDIIDKSLVQIDKLPGVWNSYSKYNLAARPMIPKKNLDKLQPDYLLTYKQNTNGQIIMQSRGIKLVKLN